jgi:galactokinase
VSQQYIIPGRIELVGKHVDYAGGASLTCAIDRALTLTAQATRDPVVRIRASSQSHRIEIPLRADIVAPADHWSVYAYAVVKRLVRDFPTVTQGVELDIHSDLPQSAGLSSSSALTIAIATALVDHNQLEARDEWQSEIPDLMAKAEYFAALETGAPYRSFRGDDGVGVAGGAQDHVAICCAKDGHVGLYSYLPARLHEHIPWPDSHVFVVANSGVTATKTGNAREAYNRTSGSIRALLEKWNAVTGHRHSSLQAALSSGTEATAWFQDHAQAGLPHYPATYLSGRLEQFLEESRLIVPGTVDALRRLDWGAFGRWVARSHALAETGLRNQVTETSALVRMAIAHGAVAASAFGAGFGGAVWSAVPASSAVLFLDQWRKNYLSAFPQHISRAEFFVTRPGSAARRVLTN